MATEIKKTKQGMTYTCEEKTIIVNVFKYFKTQFPDNSVTDLVKRTSEATGCSAKSIFQFRKEEASAEGFKAPSKTKVRKNININSRDIKYDDSVRQAIRNIVYDLKYRNIYPSLNTILKDVHANTHLPNFSSKTLKRLLLEMGFSYERVGNKAILIEKPQGNQELDKRKRIENYTSSSSGPLVKVDEVLKKVDIVSKDHGVKQGMTFTCKEKTITINVFKYFKAQFPDMCKIDLIKRTSKATGCSEKSVFQFRKEEAGAEGIKTSKTKIQININSKTIKYDDSVRQAIRNIVYDLKYRNIHPSLYKILKNVHANTQLPNISSRTLRRLLFEMGFSYEDVGNKSIIIEKPQGNHKLDVSKRTHNNSSSSPEPLVGIDEVKKVLDSISYMHDVNQSAPIVNNPILANNYAKPSPQHPVTPMNSNTEHC